jgi:hypothetical protein
MAYQYDEMGNVIGQYESEEEKRLREAANQPVKQSITYNPDGTSEMTIKGTPEALSPVNPNTPTLSMPNQPAPQQAPSREQYRTQTLQAEQAKIQQQLQSTQDPATIDRLRRDQMALQNEMARGQGQRVPSVRQTMGNMASNMIPSAQAQPVPQQTRPVAPQSNVPTQVAQVPQPAPAPASTFQGQTNEFGGMESKPNPLTQMPLDPFQSYINLQDNVPQLIKFGYDETLPEPLRVRAKQQAASLISQERGMDEAKQQIPTMSESDIAKVLREKTTGGSYLKAALFGILGMENSAMAEAAKLGVGKEIMTQIDGQPAIVKIANNGTPIEGYNAVTGKKLSASELVAAAQYASVQKGAQTHTGKMQDMRTGEVYYERTTPQGIELVDNNGKRYTGASQNLRPFGIGSDIQTKNQIQVNELTNKLAFAGPTERARIVAENEAKYGPLDPTVKQQALGSVTGAVPTQQTQAPAVQQQAPAPLPPGPVNPAQVQQPALTLAQREAQQKGRDEVMKKAGDVVADSAKIVSDITNIDRAANDALTKKNNFGTIISGMIPGEQTVGEFFKTQDHINTMNVLEQVNKQAAINARMLGINPTDRDLQFVVSTKPDITWSQEAVADWLKKSNEGTRRTLDFARKQMETGGTYVPPTPEPTSQVPPAGQFKIISVEPGKK